MDSIHGPTRYRGVVLTSYYGGEAVAIPVGLLPLDKVQLLS